MDNPPPLDPHDPNAPLTYSVDDAATLLGISAPSVYRLLWRGKLRALPGLRHKRVTRRSLLRYIDGE